MNTKKTLALLLLMFTLSTTSCATILKSELMQADTSTTGWIPFEKGYKFQEENVSFVVHNFPLTDSIRPLSRCVMMGPPLLPIIPTFLFPPYKSNPTRKIGFKIEVNSAEDTTILDLYKLRIELSDGSLIQPIAVYTKEKDGTFYSIIVDRAANGTTGRLLQPGAVTLSREKMNYNFQFDGFPAAVEEVVINFGSVQINGKDFLLPPLKYRKLTKYRYVPLEVGV
jgi:hypothetical protein